jgi:nucleoid-associated protein YgaU
MATPDLGKMVGPLPLGAWVAVVGGGLGFALYSRRQAASDVPVDSTMVPEDTSGTPGVGTGGSGQWVNVDPPSGGTSVGSAPDTNEEWGRQAVNYLIAQGYSPSVADSGIRKYLGMDAMSAQEYSLVNEALRKMGSPPQILPPPIFAPPTIPVVTPPKTTPPVVAKPPPVVKPPAPKPTVRYYYVKPGNTLSGISKKYYGRADQWSRIYNANRYGIRRADGSKGMIRNPNLILIGWKLIIP